MQSYRTLSIALAGLLLCASGGTLAQTSPLAEQARARAAAVEQKLIAWRRDIHQHPEMGDQEKRTAKLVADHSRTPRC